MFVTIGRLLPIFVVFPLLFFSTFRINYPFSLVDMNCVNCAFGIKHHLILFTESTVTLWRWGRALRSSQTTITVLKKSLVFFRVRQHQLSAYTICKKFKNSNWQAQLPIFDKLHLVCKHIGRGNIFNSYFRPYTSR